MKPAVVTSRVVQLLMDAGITDPRKLAKLTGSVERVAANPAMVPKRWARNLVESLDAYGTEADGQGMEKQALNRLAKVLSTGRLGRALDGARRSLTLSDAALARLANERYFTEELAPLRRWNFPTLPGYLGASSDKAKLMRALFTPNVKHSIDFGGFAEGAADAFNRAAAPKRRWFGLGPVIPGTGSGTGNVKITATDAARHFVREMGRLHQDNSGEFLPMGARIARHRVNKLVQRVRERLAANAGKDSIAELSIVNSGSLSGETRPINEAMTKLVVSHPGVYSSTVSPLSDAEILFHELLEASSIANSVDVAKKLHGKTLKTSSTAIRSARGGLADGLYNYMHGVKLPKDIADQVNLMTSHANPQVVRQEGRLIEGLVPADQQFRTIRNSRLPAASTLNAVAAKQNHLRDTEAAVIDRAHKLLSEQSESYREVARRMAEDVDFAMSPRTQLNLPRKSTGSPARIDAILAADLPYSAIYR